MRKDSGICLAAMTCCQLYIQFWLIQILPNLGRQVETQMRREFFSIFWRICIGKCTKSFKAQWKDNSRWSSFVHAMPMKHPYQMKQKKVDIYSTCILYATQCVGHLDTDHRKLELSPRNESASWLSSWQCDASWANWIIQKLWFQSHFWVAESVSMTCSPD